jgi:hypothetical protein
VTRPARLLVGAVVVLSSGVAVACAGDENGGGAASTTLAPDPSITAATSRGCPTQARVDELNGRAMEFGQTAGSHADAVQAALDEAAAFLPLERSADFQLMATALAGYLQVLSDVGDRLPDQMTADEQQRLDEARTAMRAPEVEAAAQRVGDYFAETCPGIDFGSSGP